VHHVVVLADTHIRRGGTRRLPDAAYAHLERADVVLHAGDILVGQVLDELSGFAPVHAVLGNNDLELVGVLPEVLELDIEGVKVGMVHDSGQSGGRARRMRRMFPAADVVVFGHSHIPWLEPGVDGQLLLNPGSATERRRQPVHTLATLDIEDGAVVASAVHEV
jgi:putative phosphoesterase